MGKIHAAKITFLNTDYSNYTNYTITHTTYGYQNAVGRLNTIMAALQFELQHADTFQSPCG